MERKKKKNEDIRLRSRTFYAIFVLKTRRLKQEEKNYMIVHQQASDEKVRKQGQTENNTDRE